MFILKTDKLILIPNDIEEVNDYFAVYQTLFSYKYTSGLISVDYFYKMKKVTFLIFYIFILSTQSLIAQPLPCGPEPAMTSTCASACVVCDIDGFTGINNLTAQGQPVPGFCTIDVNNMQFIAFIAGSEDLTIRVDVGDCIGGLGSLEVGFFQTDDCQNFDPITMCDTDIQEFTSQTFESIVPLIIGQHYYLIIDGSSSSNCNWTFNVLEGTTAVPSLTTSGEISFPTETCANFPTAFSTTVEAGAANFEWSINGIVQPGNSPDVELTFPTDGSYEVCVIASNACDDAPPSCITMSVRTPETLEINEVLCDGECVEANGNAYCVTGSYEELIILPNGCDSLITIDIEVLPTPQTAVDVWICNDDFYFIGTEGYNVTGTYEGTVLTSNFCDSLVFLELLVIECEIVGTPEEIPVICNGTASGTLIFSVDQGEPPLTYTYTNIEDANITGTGMTNLLINNEIPNIPAGIYQIYIQDDFGNDVVVLQEVTEPEPLVATLEPSDYNGFNLSCFASNGNPGNDGTLLAQPLGGVPPYTYLWSDSQTSQLAQNLEAGNHIVTITDAVGCPIEANFTLAPPPPILPTIDFIDPNCDGFDSGIIEIDTIVGGTSPFSYGLTDSTFQGNQTFTDLAAGSYNVYIMDENGCIEIIESNITAPDIPIITPIDDILINLGESTDLQAFVDVNFIDQIIWTDSSLLSCADCLDPTAMPVNDSPFSLLVTSMQGCSDSIDLFIRVAKIRNVYVPNIFSPNGDGFNDILNIFGGPEVAEVTSFMVFDRWGSTLFEQRNFQPNDPTFGWDGTFKGKPLSSDVFVWTANVEFIDGVSVVYGGDVVIVR